MKTISIRELHARTGYWARAAKDQGPLTITDRGEPVAVLRPISESTFRAVPLPDPSTRHRPTSDLDSGQLLSELRD